MPALLDVIRRFRFEQRGFSCAWRANQQHFAYPWDAKGGIAGEYLRREDASLGRDLLQDFLWQDHVGEGRPLDSLSEFIPITQYLNLSLPPTMEQPVVNLSQRLQQRQPLILSPIWNSGDRHRVSIVIRHKHHGERRPARGEVVAVPSRTGIRNGLAIIHRGVAYQVWLTQRARKRDSRHPASISGRFQALPTLNLSHTRPLAPLSPLDHFVQQERVMLPVPAILRAEKEQRRWPKLKLVPETQEDCSGKLDG